MSIAGFIVLMTIIGAGVFMALGAPWWLGAIFFFVAIVAGVAVTEAGEWAIRKWKIK